MGCVSGLVDCNGKCLFDLNHEDENCGACGNACAGGMRCRDGECQCLWATIPCDGVCRDYLWDPRNCGECGKVCDASAVCHMGVCCPSAPNLDLATDNLNCGRCGHPCPAHLQCAHGLCLPP